MLYQVTEMHVKDPDELSRYAGGALPIVRAYGGELLAVSLPRAEVIEGDWKPGLLTVHRWPSRERFGDFYAAEEYRPWRELRHQVADNRLVLLPGVDPGEIPGSGRDRSPE